MAATLHEFLYWIGMCKAPGGEFGLKTSMALPEPATPSEDSAAVEDPDAAEESEDEGVLKPFDISKRAAQLMWVHRDSLDVDDGYDDSDPLRSRHGTSDAVTTVRLPGGVVVELSSSWTRHSSIRTPDGQVQCLKGADGPLQSVMGAIRVLAIADLMGLQDTMAHDPEDDGAAPSKTLRERFADAVARHVESHVPVRCTETYDHFVYDEGPDHIETKQSEWHDVGQGVLLKVSAPHTYEHYKTEAYAWMMHPTMGMVQLPGHAIYKSMERRRSASFADALGMAFDLPVHLPMPRGNAQAARVMRLCREAVAAEPDLTDVNGAPIKPLVDQILPELMRRHAAAAAIAPADQLAAIDFELAEGIERVRLAVDRALSCSAVARRSALQAQLRFLEIRHDVPPIEAIP